MEIFTNGKKLAGLATNPGDRMASGTFPACQSAPQAPERFDASSRNTLDSLAEDNFRAAGTSVA
jgi:hypothetical protein